MSVPRKTGPVAVKDCSDVESLGRRPVGVDGVLVEEFVVSFP